MIRFLLAATSLEPRLSTGDCHAFASTVGTPQGDSLSPVLFSGLGIYISDDYNFEVMNMHEQSMLWDGMFVEISGQSLNDKK